MNGDNCYFNVRLEFDKRIVDEVIQKAILEGTAGYVCSIESNNLTIANKNPEFLTVVNHALINICDGSILAKLLGLLHQKPFSPYIGADLFLKYIRMGKYKQYFLGNTQEVLDGLKNNLIRLDPKIEHMRFETLPFCRVDEFDYRAIANRINADSPDIIWISLGAPKQEFFMNKLQPYLKRGVMFGFGAIFNFNAGTGRVRRAPRWMLAGNLEWLYRACEEPRKNVPRYYRFLKELPRMIRKEKNKLKNVPFRSPRSDTFP
ncbi:MAG: WecB/TagA/CpsF family glycosyltransferase [Tannerellaceae bacterium]|jgi:N-acetylglucosaminyldiphosphoundecaprenol N-acetyl-beta-D-mannosaminyltransferase|nr:WecB/TagA/CpsF family glycosyltransferase [Tannerellaceae bacterium]